MAVRLRLTGPATEKYPEATTQDMYQEEEVCTVSQRLTAMCCGFAAKLIRDDSLIHPLMQVVLTSHLPLKLLTPGTSFETKHPPRAFRLSSLTD
jgi:hypothetical protein